MKNRTFFSNYGSSILPISIIKFQINMPVFGVVGTQWRALNGSFWAFLQHSGGVENIFFSTPNIRLIPDIS